MQIQVLNKMTNDLSENKNSTIVIEPKTGWQFLNLKELLEYRELLYFLVWRDVKILYAQSILGLSWAILQPLIQILLFTVVFGKVAKVPTDGIPYILFSSVAIVPWTYLSQSMTHSSESLIQQQKLLGKVYFPRLIFPLTPVFSKLIDFAVSIALLIAIMIIYRIPPSLNLFLFPVFTLLMMSISAGVGLLLSSLAIRFRDVKYAMPFCVRMLMFSAPIVYSSSSIPEKYRFFYSMNPIVAVIEGFRSCFLGTEIPWNFIWPGALIGVIIFIFGAFYFKKMERIVVDVI
jgi:lipopolysaccharide transport system permease protein